MVTDQRLEQIVPIGEKRPWKQAERDAYRTWILDALYARTDDLLDRFGLDIGPDHRGLFEAVGTETLPILRSPEFLAPSRGPEEIVLRGHRSLYDHGPYLTDAGEALGADTGLLMARCLILRFPGQLELLTIRSPRSDISFNLTVLSVFGEPFDPLRTGYVCAETAAAARSPRDLRGRLPEHVWADVHERVETRARASGEEDWREAWVRRQARRTPTWPRDQPPPPGAPSEEPACPRRRR